MGLLRKTIRISTAGMVGESPKNRLRKEQAKLVREERKRARRAHRR